MTRRLGRFVRRNTIALLALFVALSGTTFAATVALPKNSVGTVQLKNGAVTKKKINKRTIKALKGNRGPAGQRGPTGLQGAKGATGPAGPFVDELPSGKTVRGTFGNSGYPSGASFGNATHISFGFRLHTAPTANFLTAGSPPTTACPGSASNPQAAPGNLCVYETTSSNSASKGLSDPGSASVSFGHASRDGAIVWEYSAAAGFQYYWGTWAVTAP